MHSGALTNTPAIDHMFAVVNKGSDGEKEGGTGMETLLKKLAALLGLPEEASEEDVLKAFEDRIGGGNGEGNTPDQKKKEGSGVETEDGAAGTNPVSYTHLMPLDKAGRLIASLNRAATYEKKVRQDMKKRAELAFEEMETELMAAIRQDPELKDELHGILSVSYTHLDVYKRQGEKRIA